MNRLVPNPTFVLSSIRSGSTLLRCILNSHPQLHAPHELHLVDLAVSVTTSYADLAMKTSGLDATELEHLLWDRVLHRSLQASGKDCVVDKTPANAIRWRRIAQCWAEAKFILLIRHPAQILESALAANPSRDPDETKGIVLDLANGVEEARHSLPGLEIRYEDLVADPTRVIAEVCSFLDVPFQPTMLDYNVPDNLVPGIGDFTERIRTGRVQPARPWIGVVPADLVTLCRGWGYNHGTS
jgi:hypothetical protein